MQVKLKEEYSTPNPVEATILAARGDYMKGSVVDTSFEEAMEGTNKSNRDFIGDLLRKGHFGPFEHPQVYIAIEGVSRVTMAQITRHRHMSFDVQSMRYVEFDGADLYIPDSAKDSKVSSQLMEEHYNQCIERYNELVDNGVPKEDARYVLPLATKVNMVMSGNIRSFLHVLDLRHSGAAQSEIQKLSGQLIEELRDYCPIIVDEWEARCKNASLQSP